MPNRNYINGRNREYRVIWKAREKGYLAFRSAGSHSPIDVVIIDKTNKKIEFVQCKPKSMSDAAKGRIEEENKELNGMFEVSFKVV